MSRGSPGCRVRIASAFLMLLAAGMVPAATGIAYAQPAKGLLGEFMTEDRQGVVRIEPCGNAYCGRVVGISDFPPGGLRDNHGVPQCQLVILHDLKPGEDGRRHGTITNPDDGRTYDAIVWIAADGDMRLRGYVGLPLLGSTQHWPRFTGKLSPDCHFSPH
jgi:uncharacterized protein (DUF2147 family)